MTKQQEPRPTAKIYVFPTRPRANSASHRQAYKAKQHEVAACATVACGAGWYHDAAIADAEAEHDLGYRQH